MRKAAATLNVASSALNRQILDLETNLGVQLFERLPRGVRLTSAGEMLLGHVRRMARDFELTRSQIEDLKGLRRGHVRVAAIEAMAGAIGRLIVASQHDHPRVSFEYLITGSREVVAAVLTRRKPISAMPSTRRRIGVFRSSPRRQRHCTRSWRAIIRFPAARRCG